MPRVHSRFSFAVSIAALLALVAPFQVSAQTTMDRPVVVALPDSFPAQDARALVIRYADRDVILLDSAHVDAEVLGAALRALQSRRASGAPDHTEVMNISGLLPRRVSSEVTAWAGLAMTISDLLEQPKARIGNLGVGRWLSLDRSLVER